MIESRQLESYRRPEPCLLVSRLCCCESAQEIVRYLPPTHSRTAASSLKQAAEFTIAKSLPHKTAFLFDCDTGRKDRHTGDVLEIVLPFRADNEKKMKKGIENILDLGTVDTSQFYRMETKEGDYGRDYEIPKLQKMDLAKHVCNLDDTQLRTVFSHLRPILEQLDTFFAHREVQDSEEAPQEIASHE